MKFRNDRDNASIVVWIAINCDSVLFRADNLCFADSFYRCRSTTPFHDVPVGDGKFRVAFVNAIYRDAEEFSILYFAIRKDTFGFVRPRQMTLKYGWRDVNALPADAFSHRRQPKASVF